MEPRIEEAKSQIRSALKTLQPGETFGMVAFNGPAKRFKYRGKVGPFPPQPEVLAAAIKWLNDLGLGYDTNLEKAMKQAFGYKGTNVVVLVTDGVPTTGETDFKRLAELIRGLNGGHARIDTIGLAGDNPTDQQTDPDKAQQQKQDFEARELLAQIARENGGETEVLDKGETGTR